MLCGHYVCNYKKKIPKKELHKYYIAQWQAYTSISSIYII